MHKKDNSLRNDTVFLAIISLVFFSIVTLAMWHFLTVGTCKHYKNQSDAQKDLLKYPRLDGNNDGQACNAYFR